MRRPGERRGRRPRGGRARREVQSDGRQRGRRRKGRSPLGRRRRRETDGGDAPVVPGRGEPIAPSSSSSSSSSSSLCCCCSPRERVHAATGVDRVRGKSIPASTIRRERSWRRRSGRKGGREGADAAAGVPERDEDRRRRSSFSVSFSFSYSFSLRGSARDGERSDALFVLWREEELGGEVGGEALPQQQSPPLLLLLLAAALVSGRRAGEGLRRRGRHHLRGPAEHLPVGEQSQKIDGRKRRRRRRRRGGWQPAERLDDDGGRRVRGGSRGRSRYKR